MNVNAVESTYTNVASTSKSKIDKREESKEKSGKEVDDNAVVYEKSGETSEDSKDSSKQIYKMSSSDRASLVQQMKADQEQRQLQLVNLVKQMITKQGGAYAQASGDDVWKFLAGGNYKVDAATQQQAQKDTAADGYWGVEQTSERIFSFAQALAGDDEEAMQKMEKAFERGYRQAVGAWGKELPGICGQTFEAVKQRFSDYYNSKKKVSE